MSNKKEPLIPPSEASPEDALRAFMKVDPKKLREAQCRERETKEADSEDRPGENA